MYPNTECERAGSTCNLPCALNDIASKTCQHDEPAGLFHCCLSTSGTLKGTAATSVGLPQATMARRLPAHLQLRCSVGWHLGPASRPTRSVFARQGLLGCISLPPLCYNATITGSLRSPSTLACACFDLGQVNLELVVGLLAAWLAASCLLTPAGVLGNRGCL